VQVSSTLVSNNGEDLIVFAAVTLVFGEEGDDNNKAGEITDCYISILST
jgi:hypothetical protein